MCTPCNSNMITISLQHTLELSHDPKAKFQYPTKLVLEYEGDAETPVINVDRNLLKKLKPHQAEGMCWYSSPGGWMGVGVWC